MGQNWWLTGFRSGLNRSHRTTLRQLPFVFSPHHTKGNRAELCPCGHHSDSGCRKPITSLHLNLNRQFQAALPFLYRPGERRPDHGGREGERERQRPARLRQMPYSSHRGYFVTSKWAFGFFGPRMLMCHRR